MRVRQLRCATWNVHRAKGTDGQVNPGRVVEVIAQDLVPLGLHVLALQEADGERRPHARIFDVADIAARTGLTYVQDPALRWGPLSDGFLGTILFLAPDMRPTHADVIDLPGHCHRGAVSVETLYNQRPVRVMSTHLSLSQPLRILQMRTLGQYLRRRPQMQTILLGDLNEWRPWGGLMLHPKVMGKSLTGPVRRSFPSPWPILPLDRILTDVPNAVQDMQTVTTPQAGRASDHLPLSALVTVP